jgi:uncharacterized protein involved in cysteine biosynthesis
MFEPHHAPLLPRRQFAHRMLRTFVLAGVLVTVSLGMGALGYHWIAGLPWIDALLNAAMILTGMGPVDPMTSAAAKLFATVYALFSGVAFLTIVALLLAPVGHRLLHRFHLEQEAEERDSREHRRPR